jgi:RNA polymerase sigma-70 factor (ECF subfamily)
MQEGILGIDTELLSEFEREDAEESRVPGSVPEFEQIFAEHHSAVYRLALRFLGRPEDAEDVTQEVFTKVWRSLPAFNGDSSVKTWVYRIAINCCIDFGRKPWRRFSELNSSLSGGLEEEKVHPLLSEGVDAERKLIADEKVAHLRHAITRLKPHLKSVLVMKELEELSYDEISATLNLSMGTISSRLNRARRALQEALMAVVPRLRPIRLAEQSR